jgi:hypothetical protein
VVKTNDGGGRESKRQEVSEREPVPVLSEDSHADYPGHVQIARLCLETDGTVSTTGIDDAERERCTKLGHGVFVAVAADLFEGLADSGNLRVHDFVLLDHDHGQSNQRSLSNEVGGVLHHGLKQVNGLIQPGASARDT